MRYMERSRLQTHTQPQHTYTTHIYTQTRVHKYINNKRRELTDTQTRKHGHTHTNANTHQSMLENI